MYTDTLVRPADSDELYVTTPGLSRLTGLTYRQLDYWARNGVIPYKYLLAAEPGSGTARRWHPDVITPLSTVARILSGLSVGSNFGGRDVKRILLSHDLGSIALGDGVRITW